MVILNIFNIFKIAVILYCNMKICSSRQEGLLAPLLYWDNVKNVIPPHFLHVKYHITTHMFSEDNTTIRYLVRLTVFFTRC